MQACTVLPSALHGASPAALARRLHLSDAQSCGSMPIRYVVHVSDEGRVSAAVSTMRSPLRQKDQGKMTPPLPLANSHVGSVQDGMEEINTERGLNMATNDRLQQIWDAATPLQVVLQKAGEKDKLGVVLTSAEYKQLFHTWVRRLRPGMPAEQQLRVGDLVLSINGVPCKGANHGTSVLQAAAPGDVRLDIRRPQASVVAALVSDDQQAQ